MTIPDHNGPKRCTLCGSTENVERHHATPRADGGQDGPTQTLCRKYHLATHNGNGDFARWREQGYEALVVAHGERRAKVMLSQWGRAGAVTTHERHAAKLSEWGRKGGEALRDSRDPDYYRRIGSLGGQATAARRGAR